MADLVELLDQLEALLEQVDQLNEPGRSQVFQLLDGIDALHRQALHRLAAGVGPSAIERARAEDTRVAWLLGAYGVGIDEWRAAEEALDKVRPQIGSHGGGVELLDVADGRVRLRMAGACSGCAASAATLRDLIDETLRETVPGYVAIDVEEDGAKPDAPPVETFVPLGRRPG